MEIQLGPEQEAFIRGRIRAGRFASANEALREAVGLLQQAEQVPVDHSFRAQPESRPGFRRPGFRRPGLTGKDLIAVMQACPVPEIDLEPVRSAMPVREPAF